MNDKEIFENLVNMRTIAMKLLLHDVEKYKDLFEKVEDTLFEHLDETYV